VKVLAIITSLPRGLWLSELTHPYWHVNERGIEVDFFSPKGGEISYTPFSDPYSAESTEKADLVSKGFLSDPALAQCLKTTRPISEANHEGYAAIHIAGGMGATFDLFPNSDLGCLIEAFWSHGKIVGGLCHGAIALANGKDGTGRCIVSGRHVTGYSIREDESLQIQRGADRPLVPHYPQAVLEKAGGLYESKGIQEAHVVQDGNLLSGQNQQSATDYGIRLRDMLLNGEIV
jgi:putative intracellular protease/amidase